MWCLRRHQRSALVLLACLGTVAAQCNAGFYNASLSGSLSGCQPCLPGSYSASSGSTSCLTCASGTVALSAYTACFECSVEQSISGIPNGGTRGAVASVDSTQCSTRRSLIAAIVIPLVVVLVVCSCCFCQCCCFYQWCYTQRNKCLTLLGCKSESDYQSSQSSQSNQYAGDDAGCFPAPPFERPPYLHQRSSDLIIGSTAIHMQTMPGIDMSVASSPESSPTAISSNHFAPASANRGEAVSFSIYRPPASE
jgi:hypothetical protein